MASPETYRIRDGVRRAKIYFLEGIAFVTVDIYDLDDRRIASKDVPIESLRSTKYEIDLVNSPQARYRYKWLENAVRQGVALPNIEVYQVAGGIPIADVQLVE